MKKLRTVMGLFVILLLLSISTVPNILVTPSKACPCSQSKYIVPPKINQINSMDDKGRIGSLGLIGLIWALISPDCVTCVLGLIIIYFPLIMLACAPCVAVLIDPVPGDEVLACLLCMWEVLGSIPDIMVCFEKCEIEPPS